MAASESNWIGVTEFTDGGSQPFAANHWLEDLANRFGRVARRFESADRAAHAVLAPASAVASLSVDSTTGAPPLSGPLDNFPEVIFLSLSSASEIWSALSIPSANPTTAESVLVAVPAEDQQQELAGIVPLGPLVLAADSGVPTRFHLFRVDHTQINQTPLATPSGQKIGEPAGNLQRRSRWFQSREGNGS